MEIKSSPEPEGVSASTHELQRSEAVSPEVRRQPETDGVGSDGPTAPPGQPRKELDLKDHIQNLTVLFTVTGVAVYGIVRFGQQAFFNRLNVTPEEVGLTQAASISRAAVIVIGILIELIMVASVLGAVGHAKARSEAQSVSEAKFKSFNLDLMIIIVWLIIVPGSLLVILGLIGGIIGLAAGGLLYIGGLVVLRIIGDRHRRRRQQVNESSGSTITLTLDVPSPRERPGLYLTIVSAIFAALFVLSGVTGFLSARHVENGGEIRFRDSFGVLGLYAENVQLRGGAATALKDRKLSYLGRANGFIVLWDFDAREPVRIPSEGVLIEHRQD